MIDFVRVWKELDLQEVEKYLIVAGELSAECYSCHKVGIEIRSASCPACAVAFKYMGFRRRVESGYLYRLKKDLPYMVFIDFDDFKKALGKRDARKLLDI